MDILADIIKTRSGDVDDWFKGISKQTPPFFYNSVDLRHSGFKLAPVDTNLFPAGFNNLNALERQNATNAVKDFFTIYYKNIHNVLIISEDHTRNKFYLDNLASLIEIISKADKNVVLTNLSVTESGEELTLESNSGALLTFKPIICENQIIKTIDGYTPEFILVNNDLTEGAPKLLKNVKQHVNPAIGFGWYKRRKTSHFDTYNNMARDFCNKFEIDPWLISTYFQRCGIVNFKEQTGIECVALKVDQTIDKIRKKYEEYNIKEKPYVFIKSDRGTYGMGIMTAYSGDEVFAMSKKIRNKMNTIKGGIKNTEVIIQEGIPTIDLINNHPAEPMIYMISGEPVGFIYRLNSQKDAYGNLNAKGMNFANKTDDILLCSAHRVISKIASHAAAWECYEQSYAI
jgi:glutamate--cysteine ligase